MKKLFLLLATVAMFATACTEGGGEIDGQQPTGGPISVSQGRVNVDFVGGECELTVNAECSWAATCSANWITIQTPEGIAGKEPLRFNVARNTESSERKTTITLKNDNYNLIQEIYVIQSAFTPGTKSDYVIYYTSSNGNIVEPFRQDAFDANIISNKYEDGQGTLLFDAPIEVIGAQAFWYRTSLTSVTIPNSVKKIGSGAFSDCTSLTSITIPDSVTEIGGGAFSGCTSLTSFYGKFSSEDKCCLIVDSTLVAFALACGKTSYIIPDSVTSIGEEAFYKCTSLTNVTIPDGVTEIGYDAFYSCSSLTSVTIPDSVTSIGDYAFTNCSSLTNVTIPDSVTEIGGGAFSDCTSLTSITIPDSVTEIGGGAFSYCTSLTSFYGKFSSEDKCCLIVDSTLVAFAPACGKTSYIIPDSVTSIGAEAFYYCTSLTSIAIPDGVTSIGKYAFYGCTSLPIENNIRYADTYVVEVTDKTLTSYTLKENVRFIGDHAFRGCDSLTNVTIPDSVTSIGEYAFYHCDSLTSVTIPDGVTSIGYYAFYDCSSLTSVYCKPTTPPVGYYYMFDYNASGLKIYVPRASVDAYKSASYWSDYSSYIVGYDF